MASVEDEHIKGRPRMLLGLRVCSVSGALFNTVKSVKISRSDGVFCSLVVFLFEIGPLLLGVNKYPWCSRTGCGLWNRGLCRLLPEDA